MIYDDNNDNEKITIIAPMLMTILISKINFNTSQQVENIKIIGFIKAIMIIISQIIETKLKSKINLANDTIFKAEIRFKLDHKLQALGAENFILYLV